MHKCAMAISHRTHARTYPHSTHHHFSSPDSDSESGLTSQVQSLPAHTGWGSILRMACLATKLEFIGDRSARVGRMRPLVFLCVHDIGTMYPIPIPIPIAIRPWSEEEREGKGGGVGLSMPTLTPSSLSFDQIATDSTQFARSLARLQVFQTLNSTIYNHRSCARRPNKGCNINVSISNIDD